MRLVNFLLMIIALAVSAGAAHIFFKAADTDPLAQRQAQVAVQIEDLLSLAKKGDVRAQYRLAELYRTSSAPLKDYGLALKWYRASADRGNTLSQYALGNMYAKGEGVKQSFYRAAEWYRLAANLSGLAAAQFALGELYFSGRGVPSSTGLAIEWYTKAANQGHAVAQFFLGQIKKEGWGTDKNYVDAYKWLSLANRKRQQVIANNDRNDPQKVLEDLATKMNSSQIKVAKKAVEIWKPGR